MPDVFDRNGLQTKTLTELREENIEGLEDIYGSDINVDQNSPDGQQVNLYCQGGVDIREVLSNINAGFDPDQAEGRVLDQRVALIGITRNGGTFSTTPVSLTVDRALNLVGLDDDSEEINPAIENLYTIKDDAGNEFYLLDSVSIVSPGTDSYSFRAADLGAVLITPNTITTPVTVIAGVTDINNPSGASNIGVDEETDAHLRTRFKISRAISSVGYLDSLNAALNNLNNVVTAIVLENYGSAESGGIPGHTIWCIVEGGDDTEIAAVIYAKKSMGCGMKGDEEVEIERPDGTIFTAKFDRPIDEDLYIQFSMALPGGTINTDYIKEQIVENIIWGTGNSAVGSTITSYVQSLNSKYQITEMEVSLNGSDWYEVVDPTDSQHRLINDTARITIST
jgi:uncharacterized phage protein gp47/JayE